MSDNKCRKEGSKLKNIMKILLIIIVLILISGLYYALTERKNGKSLLKGEWRMVYMSMGGTSKTAAPGENNGYYVKFSPNGTFVMQLGDGTAKQKGTWYEDSEINATAKEGGYLWAGRVDLDSLSTSGIITVVNGGVYGGSSTLTFMFPGDTRLAFEK